MAVTVLNLSTSGSITDATSYATASVSPTVGKLVLVAVTSSRGSDPATPTITGASTSFSLVKTQDINGFVRLSIFAGIAAGTGALTIDFGGETQERCRWSIVEVTNSKNTVATAIKQSAGNSASGALTVSATLGAFGNPANATFGACATQNAPARTITEGSGFTEVAESSADDAGVGMTIQTQFRDTNDTSVDFTASASASHLGVIGVELVEVNVSGATGAFLQNFI